MKGKYEISMKPSFTSEILGLPAKIAAQIWEKIHFLANDPEPDGKLKVKITAHQNLYRVRSGDYRIFYRYGKDWVNLLGLRKREKDSYDDIGDIDNSEPVHHPDGAEDEIDLEMLEGHKNELPALTAEDNSAGRPLPQPITEELLQTLRIPAGYFSILMACKTEEELFNANLPQEIIIIVHDNLMPKPIEEVLKQPDLVLDSVDDLVRFKNGDLLTFLLKLDEAQVRLTKWAMKGPTMIRGGAGTGKSTVALYRVKEILERQGAGAQEKILFTTYTRALINASSQLLEQLLGAEKMKQVKVSTCDSIAREIVASTRKLGQMESRGLSLGILQSVRKSFKPEASTSFESELRAKVLDKLSDSYLLEEFEWIIEGRGLESLEEYLQAPRPGRGIAMKEGLREAVWQLHQAFLKAFAEAGIERFSLIRLEALKIVRAKRWSGHFDHVLVDEAQDLAPSALALMAEIAVNEEGIFFAADDKQSLYSRNYSWKLTHPRLKFQGRTAYLKMNHRSTIEIDRAAYEIIKDIQEEDCKPSESFRNGPIPLLLRGVKQGDEGIWLAKFIRQMTAYLRMKTSSAAVLAPNEKFGRFIAEKISEAGLTAQFFPGRDLNLKADVVKVLTLHSAKGLEFPVVAIVSVDESFVKNEMSIEEFPELLNEQLNNEKKLLYVGMTRAMRGLLMLVGEAGNQDLFSGLSADNWSVEIIK
ncbi:MAG: UvrD-helicase domain-containing protein [Candidatus Riflebacteria bacterium]